MSLPSEDRSTLATLHGLLTSGVGFFVYFIAMFISANVPSVQEVLLKCAFASIVHLIQRTIISYTMENTHLLLKVTQLREGLLFLSVFILGNL